MRKVLRIIGIILAGSVALILAAVLVVFVITTSRRGRTYDVTVTIPTDEATVARGEHIVKALAGCDGCHGENLGGMVLMEDPAILNSMGQI